MAVPPFHPPFYRQHAALILVALAILAAMSFLVARSFFRADPVESVQQEAPPISEIVKAPVDEPKPPKALAQRISALGSAFDGRVGIVVRSVDEGWSATYRSEGLFPQQSVSKLWVAATVLEQVDGAKLRLSDTMTLTAKDLTIFHQPIRERIGSGTYTATIAELMTFAMTQSDNTANDALFRKVGGQEGVGRFLAQHNLAEIAIGPGEKDLQTKTAGMKWEDRFSYGRTFWRVRDSLPPQVRAKALSEYVTNPPDGATPAAVAFALTRLVRGDLLSKGSTRYLLDLMAKSKTGPDRLRAGLSAGWSLAHKTGTGQVLGTFATAYNDVGILTSPTGKRYALVVMIASTQQPVPVRQALMAEVTQAAIAGYD
jgi:beta-lactamase class A